jgi:hypothetical protein
VTRAPGYLLRVEEGELDLERFEALVKDARERLADGDAPAARDELAEALGLWRGPPESVAAQLEELRLSAQEDLMHASLESGEASSLIPQLEELVASHPLRERPRELLMLALYRAGRQADALDLFRRTRELFVGELGIEPGQSLRDLEGAILRQEPALQVQVQPRQVPTLDSRARRRRRWILVAAVVLVAAAVALAALLAREGGGSTPSPPRTNPQLRAFVYKIENLLAQSHDGRVAVGRALAGAFDCSLPPQVAAAQLDGVQQNRQSLLDQLAALHVPAGEAALKSSDLLQQAMHASIAADWIYRDWLRRQADCPRGAHLPAAGRRLDARATRRKQEFLSAFDPLARRFGRHIWRADQF